MSVTLKGFVLTPKGQNYDKGRISEVAYSTGVWTLVVRQKEVHVYSTADPDGKIVADVMMALDYIKEQEDSDGVSLQPD